MGPKSNEVKGPRRPRWLRQVLLVGAVVLLAAFIARGFLFGGNPIPGDGDMLQDRGSIRGNRDGTPGMRVP